jgi:hypothetical protein
MMAKVNTPTGGSPQIFLYDEGNEVTEITGGWNTAFTGGNQTFTKNVDNLQIVNDHTSSNQNIRSYFQTTNLIDLTNFSGIIFEYTIPNVSADDYDFSIGINQADGSTIFDFQKIVQKTAVVSPSELDILSITNVTGSYFIYAGLSTTDDDSDTPQVNYFKVYLIP